MVSTLYNFDVILSLEQTFHGQKPMNLIGLRLDETKVGFNRQNFAQPVSVHLIFSTPAIGRSIIGLSGPPTGSTTPINLSTGGLKVNYKNSKKPKERNPKIWMPKKDFFKVLHIKSRVFQRIMSQSATGFNFSICITLTLTF